MALLDINDLHIEFSNRHGTLVAIDGVSLSLNKGEILGVVGESGAGKSTIGNAVIGLLQPPGKMTGGSVSLEGRRIDQLPKHELRTVRGRRIGMIFQDPLTSLDPLQTVERQLVETMQVHLGLSMHAARERAIELLDSVGIDNAAIRLGQYPHQFSGGMRQRVVIALALCCEPEVIIADEPTTALDVTIQGQILYEVQKLCRESGTALIWITHDLAVVSGLADRLAVMYAGRIVETGGTADIIESARHPYTHGLMASIPSIDTRGKSLAQIPGATPSLLKLPDGCPFRTRCGKATEQCRQEPPRREFTPGHSAFCWHPGGAS
jgi:peptide/nickel transport system ATP-binding protein